MAVQKFFYDGQIRRFVNQFIKIISGFQVQFGKDRDGNTTLQRVPVIYGDGQRQAFQILNNNSENSLPTVPAMSVYINGLSYDRERVQEPNFIGKLHVRERAFNEETGLYEQRQGNAFTIERLMPVPHTLQLKLDIWTSNTEQKLQLIEQLTTLFNPELELQSTDNYIDWTSLTAVYRTDISWTNRSVPIGTDNPIDVATMTFEIPIWLSVPAKVKKLGVIHKIINSIHDSQGDLSTAITDDSLLLGNRQYFTPLDYKVLLVGNTLTLMKYSEIASPRDPATEVGDNPVLESPTKLGVRDIWRSLINVYGTLTNGISQVRLLQDDELTEIVGTVSYHPTDDSLLLFNPDPDTLPTNTLPPVDAIINPKKITVDSNILTPTLGTRYIILHDVGDYNNPLIEGELAWRGSNGVNLIAKANDIIEYNGTHWTVSFSSNDSSTVNYVSNLTTGIQYKWTGTQWVKSYEGEYHNGRWTLVL